MQSYPNQQLAQQNPSCSTITAGQCKQGSQQNSTAVQIEAKITKYGGITNRKLIDIDKKGVQLLTHV